MNRQIQSNRVKILDRPIAFQRPFVELTGSITAGLLLSQAYYWALRSEGGRFWKTMSQWQEETGLTRREQDHARKILRGFPFWLEQVRKLEHRVWYTVDPQAILDAVDRALSMAESANDVGEKGQPTLAESAIPSTSQNTAQTTEHAPPSLCLPSVGPPPLGGAKVATPAKKRPSVASTFPNPPEMKEGREPTGKGQEWLALKLDKRGIGCDLFRTQWRLHFAKHANNGQSLARVIAVFLEECACLRLMIPPAFARAAEDRCGIKITALRGEAKAQIGICAG
jgi:hypothetical protein